jgi:hypothetical protein
MIAEDHAAGVSVAQTTTDMNDYGELLEEAKLAVVGHSTTLHVFHDEVGIPVVVAEVEHGYDWGVAGSRAAEPRENAPACHDALQKHPMIILIATSRSSCGSVAL